MTQVIINDVTPREQFTASGGQTVFNTLFTADATTDIDVYARATGVEPNDVTQIVSTADYTVTFIGATATTRVTFAVGRTAGDIITIARNTPSDRENLYINTNFTPSMLNQDFGLLTLIDQQNQMYDAVLAPHYNVSAIIEPVVDNILPILGANQIWAKNNADTAIIAYDVPASSGLAPKTATYLIQTTAGSELPNAQIMGNLASGLVVNTTATGVQLTRTLTGTPDRVTVTNGSGIGGDPTVDIAATYVGQASITTLGTITTGVWNGTVVTGTYGGTGVNNGASTLTYGGNTSFVGAFTFAGTLTGNTAVTFPTSGTLATVAGTVSSITGTANQITASAPTGAVTLALASNPIIPGTGSVGLPSGTTAQRAGAAGAIRFNSQTSVFEGTVDGATWNSFAGGGGPVLSVTGTANQVEIDNTNPATPIVLLPAVIDVPGTFNIQASTAVDEIINDNSMATATATNLATALSIKTYIDQTALTGTSVYAATTATLNAVQAGAGVGATLTDNSGTFAALTLDGIAIPLNSFILNKDQAAAANQGIYKLTTNGDGISIPWVLTRSTTYNTPDEINQTGLITVRLGNTLAGTQWFNSATIVTVDTTAFSYSQFGASLLSNTLASGKIFRGNASNVAVASTAQYPDAAGTVGNVLTSDGTNFVSSPNTGSGTVNAGLINQVAWYAANGTTVDGLATANNGVLITSAGGVPSISSTLPSGIAATNMSLTTPTLGDATATSITFSPTTGGIVGTTTNDAAASGYVGEIFSTVVLLASAVSMTSSVAANVASIVNLPAGNWDVYGYITTITNAATLTKTVTGALTTSSATIPSNSGLDLSRTQIRGLSTTAGQNISISIPPIYLPLSAPTTVYLVANTVFTVNTLAAYGVIFARRRR